MYKFVSIVGGVTTEMIVEYIGIEIKEPTPVEEYILPEGSPSGAELQELLNSIQQ
jgi:hypothetical protein